MGLGSRLTSANYPQRPFLPVERGLSFSLPLILLNWHQRLSPLAGPPVVVTVTAAPGFRSDDPPVFTSCGGVRKLCGSARFSVSLLSPTATKVYLIYSFSVGGVWVWGPRERWAVSWGVADRPIPSRWACPCNSGTRVPLRICVVGDRHMDQTIRAFGNGKHSHLRSRMICNFHQMSSRFHPCV